jgi:2-amino-4-hydroxy-6-hydroxymethyldihydropteridine diphosphokinase
VTELAADALVIGLGGNVGGDQAIRARFVAAREALGHIGAVSSAPLYRSAPIGPAQPHFLNSALRVRAPDASPDEVLALIRELERLLGRDRAHEVRWGPRTIDLDLLLWGQRELRTPELEIPHPRLGERRFVILPLIALLGDELVLSIGRSLGELARDVADQDVEEVAATW